MMNIIGVRMFLVEVEILTEIIIADMLIQQQEERVVNQPVGVIIVNNVMLH